MPSPRLLSDLAAALECETDPDDPTYFGRPTESGVENFLEADGSASDVWGRFEVLTRYQEFEQTHGFGDAGYRRTVDGPVRYVPVRGAHGALVYPWASGAENGASFEPVDVGNDDVYKAGRVWLERLRSAHDRGLGPSEALAELSGLPDEGGAGQVDPEAEPLTMDLADLRELASDG